MINFTDKFTQPVIVKTFYLVLTCILAFICGALLVSVNAFTLSYILLHL